MNRGHNAFVGLDIGTSKVACVVGVLETDAAQPTVVGVGKSTNQGVRKGAIIDVDDTVSAITAAIQEAENISGRPIEQVTVSVGGSHIKSLNSKGVIAVGGMHHAITADDVIRVEDAATVLQLPPNREILQVFSQQFRLDGQDNIKDPVGMSGVRLEVDAHVVTAATPALKNLQRSVYQSGLTITTQVMAGLAAARSVLDKRQRENGTVLIDIGAGTTNLAVFEEGEVMHTAVLPLGSGHITNDIAIGLRTDLDTAENIKLKHVALHSSRHRTARGASIKSANGDLVQIDLSEVNQIVSARLEELFEQINKELEKVKRAGKLPGGAVLTGGGANLEHIDEIARNILRLPVTIGKPSGFSGIVDTVGDPAYAVATGLMLEDIYHSNHSHGSSFGRSTKDILSYLKRLTHKLKP